MKSGAFRSVCIGLGFSLMILIGLPVNAATYNFSQDGFTGGGLIAGTFDAIDLDMNGQISFFDGEVTKFDLSFSGNSIVGTFTFTFNDLYGLVYDLNSEYLGDGITGDNEGILSYSDSYEYASGLGALPELGGGGRVTDITEKKESNTEELIAVSSVPIPATFWILGSGLLGLAGFRRKVKNSF